MIKNSFTLSIIFVLFFIVSGWAEGKETGEIVSVTKGLKGYTLSVNAQEVVLEKIIKELTEKSDIRVVVYEKAITFLPVSVSFKEVRLEEGIKRVIKAAGVKNHLIKYKKGSGNKVEIAEVTLLGSGKKGRGITFSRESMRAEKESIASTKDGSESNDTFSKKVESFKEKYQWEDTETQELAGHILEMMPDDAKEPGLESLVSTLDGTIAEGEEVDEEKLYQAIESTVPPDVAPIMMKSLKESVAQYRSGEEGESARNSANKLYQEHMNKNKQETRVRKD